MLSNKICLIQQVVILHLVQKVEHGDVVPDQVYPASDAIPQNSNRNGSAGTSNEYARGNHQHPLQVSTILLAKDTAHGKAGVVSTYARSDHMHHVNLSNDIPLKDTGTGTAGMANIYTSTTHQHPLNVDTITANVPLVNATAAANGTSDFYSRNDHVHPQQLTYTGPLTSTMFIKNGTQATDILLAGGDSKPTTDIAGDGFVAKTGKTLQSVENTKYVLNTGSSTSYAGVISGIVQIIPTTTGRFDDGLRIARTVQDQNAGSLSIEFICSRTSNSGAIQGQWVVYTPSTAAVQAPQSLIIAVANQASDITRGLQISIDGNTLSFNDQVIAQTNPTAGQTTISSSSSGATNGSVNYSAGNPIIWGVNSVDTNGGFYCDGPKVYWRAKPITLSAVPP
ncbi:MAG: hypothetical protein EZS28_001354 [Streblomastix strix]|uniref:Uncharacterized protein n=1 Tax=Streblomastix strix TaxID=222440 RepID=A0A5J4X965_9EUKA|nr:MAG: hypothetical protein EZS28_001354 [Streblomastix strix]